MLVESRKAKQALVAAQTAGTALHATSSRTTVQSNQPQQPFDDRTYRRDETPTEHVVVAGAAYAVGVVAIRVVGVETTRMHLLFLRHPNPTTSGPTCHTGQPHNKAHGNLGPPHLAHTPLF
ncbi:hypothetical protein HanRHA438_Chr11g0530711 [Helianthus annuus]|nr:hypothetical protein HanRHA438_Chr11g0530711 [Helianthus annuus]